MSLLEQGVPALLQVVLLCLVTQGLALKLNGRLLYLMFFVCMHSSLSCLTMFTVMIDGEVSMRTVLHGNWLFE
jgi:hypothetical protein